MESTHTEKEFSMTLVDNNGQVLPVTYVDVLADVRENHAEITVTQKFQNEKDGKTGTLSVVRPADSIPGEVGHPNAVGKSIKVHGKFSHRDETENAENAHHYDIPNLEGDVSLKDIPLSAVTDISFSFITKVKFDIVDLESKTFTFTLPKDTYQLVNTSGAEVPNHVKVTVRAQKGINNVQITSGHNGEISDNENGGVVIFKNVSGDDDITISFDKVDLTPTTVLFNMDPIKKDFQYVYINHNPILSYLGEMKAMKSDIKSIPYFLEFEEDFEKSMIFYYAIERSGSMVAKLREVKDFFETWLKMLPSGCRFNVISFGDKIEALYPISQELNEETKVDAIEKVSHFICDFQTCNFTNFLESVKTQIIESEDDDYIYSPNRIFVISSGEITPDTAIEKLGEITGDRDVRVYYISLRKPVTQEVINAFIKEGGGLAGNVFDMTELSGVIGLMIDHCYQPNYKALEIIPHDSHQDDFKQFIDKKLTLSKIGNLRDPIEFITRIKAEQNNQTGFRIKYDSFDKNSVSEDVKVNVVLSHNPLFRKIYNYNKSLEEEKMTKSAKIESDNCGSGSVSEENGVTFLNLAINLDGDAVKPKKFPTSMTVDEMKTELSNYLAIPLANLEFSINKNPITFTGTLSINQQNFEERIDINTIGDKKPIPPNDLIIKAISKNGLWEVSPGLLASIKKTPEQWEKIYAEAGKKFAAQMKDASEADKESALFSLAVIKFYKTTFPKALAKFTAFNNNATHAISKIIKGFNPGIQTQFDALLK